MTAKELALKLLEMPDSNVVFDASMLYDEEGSFGCNAGMPSIDNVTVDADMGGDYVMLSSDELKEGWNERRP